jgi:hypothetical protein
MSDPVSPSLKNLPKVAVDLKSELEGFNYSCMKKAETAEKNVLPSAGGKSKRRLYFRQFPELFTCTTIVVLFIEIKVVVRLFLITAVKNVYYCG